MLPSFACAQTELEEVPVLVTVSGIGSIEMIAIVSEEKVALPVTELFDMLRIKNEVTDGFSTISGFFADPAKKFLIDAKRSEITYLNKKTEIPKEAMIATNTNVYLSVEYFSIFGLKCDFNFRALEVKIISEEELPLMKELRLEYARQNRDRLRGDIPVDTTIKQLYRTTDLGVLNWNIIMSQQTGGRNVARGTLGLGGLLAGGELTATLNISPNETFLPARQIYSWRRVNNESRFIKQVTLGKFGTQTVASLFGPIVGMQVTNRPTINRKIFGTYRIMNTTLPNWDVELYVNQVLVDYKRADSAGNYSFDIPLVYGASNIILRFYGPYGESSEKQENINIPFNLIPKGEWEYSAAIGIIEADQQTRFSQGVVQYGLSNNIAIGAGAEHLSSITNMPVIPFVNASARISRGALLYADAAPGARYKAQLNYALTRNALMNLSYTKYEKGQKVININALEERRATLSLPIRLKKFTATSAFTFNQLVSSSIKTTTAEWMFATYVRGVTAQVTSYGIFTDNHESFTYSNVGLTFQLPYGLRFTPNVQVTHKNMDVIFARGFVEKRLFGSSTATMFFEKNFTTNLASFGLSFVHDLRLAQLSVSATRLNNRFTMFESIRGGLIYDRYSNFVSANSRINTGKGALHIIPFLDIDCDGVKDAGEPKLSGLKYQLSGGNAREGKDTTIRITELEPYNYYYLKIDKFSFDNIAWQIRNSNIRIAVEPNHFKTLYVPVAVLGEASGMVFIKDSTGTKGQGQILINIYRGDTLVSKVISEPDGYYSYVGLAPGSYTARIDESQRRRIGMQAEPASMDFEIKPNIDGDIVDGLEFTISRPEEK